MEPAQSWPRSNRGGLPLQDVGVLVTRPAHQAAGLCARIEAAGARAIAVPVIEIETLPALSKVDWPHYRLLVFVSANAVDHFLASHCPPPIPSTLMLAATGPATAARLSARGYRVALVAPPPYTSEALLTHAGLDDVAGSHVLIVRGAGGRGVLGAALRARGAVVDEVAVYRRVPARSVLPALRTALSPGGVDVVTTTSNAILQQLHDTLGLHAALLLLDKPLVVTSPRAAALAYSLGFVRPACVAARADDAGLVQALISWRIRSSV